MISTPICLAHQCLFAFTGVLVTGASGYVALHCVQQLLNAGYTVRGTVRSLTNAGKVGPLRKMRGADERLELVVADLERPDDWPRFHFGLYFSNC